MTRLDFDYEDYFNELFSTTAVLMWSTHHAAITFAFYINRLYNKQLMRRDNITLHTQQGESLCSVFTQQDNLSHTTYLLVDNPNHMPSSRSSVTFFDKTLLIMGPDAYEQAHNIYADLGNSTPLPSSDEAHTLLRQAFLDNGVLEYALFDFSEPDDPQTTYFATPSADPRIRDKQRLFLRKQREYACDLLLALDAFLPNYEDETKD